jgi:cytochrome c-type biogenesis protein CcmH
VAHPGTRPFADSAEMKKRLLAALLFAAIAATSQAAASPTPRTSLTDVENDVMCVSCHEPLALAQSPQAIAERAFISRLIAQGETKQQIEKALVAQYGLAVLGKPPPHGFNLTVYVLPPALLIAGITVLAITLPRWRRRATARSAQARSSEAAPVSSQDALRLEQDLARFDA